MQWLDEDGIPPWQDKLTTDELSCLTPDIVVPQFDFKIKSIFTCGSPIGNNIIK